jgi:AcrR family transcriptional regulator
MKHATDSEQCQDRAYASRVSDRPAYHHGDLAAALVAEALTEVRANGANAVSLRGIAHAVGVSPSAAYHHFPDKATLLQQVGMAGVELLEEHLRVAVESVSGDGGTAAVERFVAAGRGYLGFAVEEENLFRHMFGPLCSTPEGQRTDTGAFQILINCLDDLEIHGLLRPGIRPDLELLAWTAVHGAAELTLQSQLTPDDLTHLMATVTRTFLSPSPSPSPSA